MSEDIDIGQISEALNDKMDRDVGNPATIGKERIVGWGIPDYDNPIEITESPYTAIKDGLVVLNLNSSNRGSDIIINGETISHFYYSGGQTDRTINAPIAKGDVLTFGTYTHVYLYPMKGE